jgi:CBS domain-containing protein
MAKMLMLTELLRYRVVDSAGREAQLVDLAAALLDADYPPITAVVIGKDGETKHLPWSEVTGIDVSSKRIKVRDLSKAAEANESKDVLLNGDILDALILDLLGRRTTRVCDLMLDDEAGQLSLKGADAGMAAMLRRVFRGHWTKPNPSELFDWKYVEFLRGDPQAVTNGEGYRLRINRLPAGEIARLADYIPYLHAAELLMLLPDKKAADVMESTNIGRQLQIIEEWDEDEAISILTLMSPDLAADVVGRLELTMMRRYLSMMPKKHRECIIELLKFPEDSVGGVMTNDILILPVDANCAEAKQHIEQVLENVHFSAVVFVVTDRETRRLRGSINLKDMLAAEPSQTLEEIMDPYLQSLDPFADANEAAYRIVSSQLPAMPVINKDAAIIGAMTVEAAISRLVSNTSNLQRLRVFS